MAKQGTSPARAQRRRAAGCPDGNEDVRSGIWIVHAIGREVRIPLLGDLRHEHFYFTEGDPEVGLADYALEPTPTSLDRADERPLRFDGVITLRDGSRRCRRVAVRPLDPSDARNARLLERYAAAARRLGGQFEEITAAELDAAHTRISNWIRIIGSYLRCRGRSLGVAEALVMAQVSASQGVALGEVLDRLSDQPPATVLAAVASLLRQRKLSSDLDERTWSRHTLVRRIG
ncbi:hypothetical protein [Luteibacter sp. ME-Dv--P-043b]|uniref:hypothetical protein n=1 Tax=Luteibacter sp. ME-Dv--P-043b TaxID=3040291 RepID=UPI002556C91C|nr:hypothetical protein [Luteibacter sp. ME-Dv--P-043b]